MLAIQPLQNRLASVSEHTSGFAPIVCCQANTNKRSVSKLDKSASQFESVGVSRSCFCVSKIKQDSANLVLG
ncbi:hypothetical protein RGC45_07990 [Helicobacter pylori]|uniref:hypothetical protein n=1 Tax=Helicobacter pylori TaxID=210 RepID=UPI0029286A9C|nr:hypothetical protein [Helicobacter pylori]MDU9728964.1 hypothetical protein [Helicobacter pylori]